jgi:hypothetical protein
MFSIRQNLLQRSTRLPKKSQLLTIDTAYLGQPFARVVGKNENTMGLDVSYNAQPFVAAYNNRFTSGPTTIGSNHIDVENWLNTVYWNGGSASSTTISALNTFCSSIDSTGLRSKFYRLNLFCGNNLLACMVPLYVGPISRVGGLQTTYGYGIDMNFSFLSSDYNETGANCGLQGNGSKYLDTGMYANNLTISNRHFYVEERTSPGDYHTSIGIRYSGDAIAQAQAFYVYRDPQNRTNFAFSESSNLLVSGHTPCRLLCCNDGAGTGTVYRNGSSVGSGSGFNVSTQYPNGTVTVFGLRQIYEGTITSKTTARISSYSLGSSLNSTDATNFSNIVATFNINMSRS